ncbi:hypothetical protein JKG68_00035 [Microvirga aerilata]|uniref:Uncharacterized protein n=1 Tax=Microvirga aerilata TaxID=670292 RepID=A0A936Z5D2_9HYPH|nr:hypothetical protein [Microvirga aerilata]MBL0402351.1 hypothetical protein [Microvirga aerilata]
MSNSLSNEEINERRKFVASQYSGILPQYEAFYIHSVMYAADCSANAFERYKIAVEEYESPTIIVAIVQEALTHAAALSRFFWPILSKKGDPLREARGAALRGAFGLDERCPLYSRSLRNAIEHYDERLDSFLLVDRVGSFFPTPLVNTHKLADDVIRHIFKMVDPDEEIFVLFGEKYELSPIRDAVFDVYEKCAKMLLDGRLK